jgi:hypothetical protein
LLAIQGEKMIQFKKGISISFAFVFVIIANTSFEASSASSSNPSNQDGWTVMFDSGDKVFSGKKWFL